MNLNYQLETSFFSWTKWIRINVIAIHMRYWSSVSSISIMAKFFFVFSSRSIKTQKRTRPIFSHLDRTSLVNKGFIMWPKIQYLLAGPTREIPTDHLTCSGSQSECRIHFILPASGFSHVIKLCIALSQGDTGNQGLPGEDGKDGQSVGWYIGAMRKWISIFLPVF